MKNFGVTYSTVRPDNLRIDAYTVYVCSDVVSAEGQYEYRMVQYDKNEYICILAERNAMLEQQLVDTQMALCELYEGTIAE